MDFKGLLFTFYQRGSLLSGIFDRTELPYTISSVSIERGFCEKWFIIRCEITDIPGYPGKDQGDEIMKKFRILIGLLLLIAIPAGAMAACNGSCANAAPAQSCEPACPMGSSNGNIQATCADQSLCPAGGQDCGVTGCSTSSSCVSAGCSDGTGCQQMQTYCGGMGEFTKNSFLGIAAQTSRFSEFIVR